MKRHRQSRQSWSKMALDPELRGLGRWRSEGNKDSWVCKALHPGVDFWWVNRLPVADSNSVGSCQNQCLFSLLREMLLVGRLSREATGTNDWAAVRAGTLASGSWGSDSYFCHDSLYRLRHATWTVYINPVLLLKGHMYSDCKALSPTPGIWHTINVGRLIDQQLL